jgi:hypothetical protein
MREAEARAIRRARREGRRADARAMLRAIRERPTTPPGEHPDDQLFFDRVRMAGLAPFDREPSSARRAAARRVCAAQAARWVSCAARGHVRPCTARSRGRGGRPRARRLARRSAGGGSRGDPDDAGSGEAAGRSEQHLTRGLPGSARLSFAVIDAAARGAEVEPIAGST